MPVVEKRCATCRWWRPHFHYPTVGYCALHHKITTDDDYCDRWEPVRVEKGKFYWCETCRRRLSWEEALEHIRAGHRVYEAAYVEPDVREEIVAAME